MRITTSFHRSATAPGEFLVGPVESVTMQITEAITALGLFSGQDVGRTLSKIELAVEGATADSCTPLLHEYHAHHDALAAAGLVKRLAGQVNVVVHALGILLCLPEVLQPGEVIESISLGAGNTGKPFDLETSHRVAEFKFIAWQGGPEAIRQNSLFKDFYYLAEHDSSKSKHLYVLGTEFPLRFLNSRRALESVLSKNVTFHNEFRVKYPGYQVVRDYYLPRRSQVSIEDVSAMVPGLTDELMV